MITKVVNLPRYVDWNKVYDTRLSCCYCLALNTDLEQYIEIEGHEDTCVDEFIKLLELDGLCISGSAYIYDKSVRRKTRESK